jgi:hypothetical protein
MVKGSKFRPFQFSRTATALRKFAAQSHVEKNSTAKGRNRLLSSSSQPCCPDDPPQPRLAAEAKMRRTGLSASWRRYDSDHRRLTHRRLIGVNRRKNGALHPALSLSDRGSECKRLVSTVTVKTVLASRHDEDNSCLCWLPIALRVSGNVVRQELAALLSPDGSSVPSEALKVR